MFPTFQGWFFSIAQNFNKVLYQETNADLDWTSYKYMASLDMDLYYVQVYAVRFWCSLFDVELVWMDVWNLIGWFLWHTVVEHCPVRLGFICSYGLVNSVCSSRRLLWIIKQLHVIYMTGCLNGRICFNSSEQPKWIGVGVGLLRATYLVS